MELKAAVERYMEVAKEYGRPMPLARFEHHRGEIESSLSAWDEDYHLHRHFELVPASSEDRETYSVNGIPYSAIIFFETIRDAFA